LSIHLLYSFVKNLLYIICLPDQPELISQSGTIS